MSDFLSEFASFPSIYSYRLFKSLLIRYKTPLGNAFSFPFRCSSNVRGASDESGGTLNVKPLFRTLRCVLSSEGTESLVRAFERTLEGSRFLLGVALSACLALSSPARAGFLEDYYDSVGAQGAVTPAGVYQSQGLSVATGGSFVVKVPRKDFTPVAIEAPHLKAGCGGIDVFLGAFALPSREEFGRANGLDERPVVALVAGSRRGEIEANLPLMCALAPRFPHYQFVVTGVSWLDRGLYDRHLAGTDVRMVVDQTYETLRNAVAAVVTSGTATLETALMRIPEVVVYRTVWWQVWLRPYVLKVPFISLVNLNLGREAVRELVQSSADPTEAQRALGAILPGGSERERMLGDYDELHAVMGGPGASDRFARDMVAELRKGATNGDRKA